MPAARSLVPGRIGRAFLWVLAGAAACLLVAGGLWVTLPDPAPLAKENPKTTALIEQRKAEAKAKKRRFRFQQTWIGIDRVPKRMVEAVVLSEDARFFGHEGIDWSAMRDAAKHDLAKGSFARGASTITQQLAKNLWFGTEKSLWRKAKEAVLASKMERALSKRRVLAIYLNVVEWGDGVFGVEAGARHHFGVSASQLTTAQSVVLASMLPAPRRVDLAHPSRWLSGRAHRLLDRMRDEGRLGNDDHLSASAELERILAGPAPADETGSEEPPEEEGAPVAPAPEPSAPPAAEPAEAAATKGAEPTPAAPAEGEAHAPSPVLSAEERRGHMDGAVQAAPPLPALSPGGGEGTSK